MLVEGKRPRELHWYHAGPMLFGDWGTSRLYVLGLAFYYTRHAAFWFMLAMCLLLLGVGWAYQVICRVYPDGGGVYSSARHRSPTLAVIGGLLLCADYIVTAAISSLDAFHYLNLSRPVVLAAIALFAIGLLNYFGPKKSGTVALAIALLTVALTLVIGVAGVPWLESAEIARPAGNPLRWWTQFTTLILAISGVEAVANMTGLMVEPVARTAARSICPVLIEIVIFNLLLTVAMLAVPLDFLGGGDPANAFTLHRDDMLRAMAQYYVGPTFALVSAFVFALLLLSAANTAITDLVSIQFMMSRDGELPKPLGLLNAWGMPVIPLLAATAVPVVVVLAVADVERLADLYAIGVVGAVAINLGTCSTNRQVELKWFERAGMGGLAAVMVAVWITIAYEKPHALLFALCVLGLGLSARFLVKNRAKVRQWVLDELHLAGTSPAAPVPALATAGEPVASPSAQLPTAPKSELLPGPCKHILVATPGDLRLFRFALEQAQVCGAALDVLFVRRLAVPVLGSYDHADVDADRAASHFFDSVSQVSRNSRVPLRSTYIVTQHVPSAIANFALACGADVLILAPPRQTVVRRALRRDVLRPIRRRLKDCVRLVVHP